MKTEIFDKIQNEEARELIAAFAFGRKYASGWKSELATRMRVHPTDISRYCAGMKAFSMGRLAILRHAVETDSPTKTALHDDLSAISRITSIMHGLSIDDQRVVSAWFMSKFRPNVDREDGTQ